MFLAARIGDFDKILVRQTTRPSQDRSGHQYVVVERKLAYSLSRSRAYPGQIVAEKSQSLRVCPLHQPKENIVEYRDWASLRRWASARNSLVICRNISARRSGDRLSTAPSNSAIKAADAVAAIVSLVLQKLQSKCRSKIESNQAVKSVDANVFFRSKIHP